MEILSLIYTYKIDSNIMAKELELRYGFKKFNDKSNIFIEPRREVSLKIKKNEIEIMYLDIHLKEIIELIEVLSTFNQNCKISIKAYKEKEKNNIIQMLTRENYYFV